MDIVIKSEITIKEEPLEQEDENHVLNVPESVSMYCIVIE